MAFKSNLADEILHRADIVEVISNYIPVTKKGRNYVAICPFHDDKNPSLHISKDKQIYKCFACGAGGNAISFVQNYEKISFGDALKKVADLIGFDDERLKQYQHLNKIDHTLVPLYNCLEDLTKYYQYCLLTEEGKEAKNYLDQRGLASDIEQTFRLGYALNNGEASIEFLQKRGHSIKTIEAIGIMGGELNQPFDRNRGRVMFPIADRDGKIVGFSGRILQKRKDVGKYVNSPETPVFKKSQILYNFDRAKTTARHDGYVYILEGFMDVFALYRAGINSAVALMGTALTKEHIAMLRSLNAELRICLDGDLAGQMGMLKIAKELSNSGLSYSFVDSSNEQRDPDEILTQDGKEALLKYLDKRISHSVFAMQYYRLHGKAETTNDRRRLVVEMLPIIDTITNQEELMDGLLILKSLTNFPLESLKKSLDLYRKRSNKTIPSFREVHPERELIRHFSFAERDVIIYMLHDKRAATYYEANINYLYDDIYRSIANFLIDYYDNHEAIDVAELINTIASNDTEGVQDIIEEVSSLSLRNDLPAYSDKSMDELRLTIEAERNKEMKERDLLEQTKGKSDAEKAAIYAQYYRKNKDDNLPVLDKERKPN
jgi:DNA primase